MMKIQNSSQTGDLMVILDIDIVPYYYKKQ